jgi:hypothetical protein
MFSLANKIGLVGMFIANIGIGLWVTGNITDKTHCFFNVAAGTIFGISAYIGGIWTMTLAEIFFIAFAKYGYYNPPKRKFI